MKASTGRALLLVIAAIILNIVLGAVVRQVLKLPLYLDSIGTILVGALLGPLAGAAIGALSNLIWAGLLGVPTIAPYSITAAFIGWAAGYAVSCGAFRRWWTAALAGLLISDPLDKAISFTIAWLLWRVLRPYFRPPWQRGSRVFEPLQGYTVAVVASLLVLLFCFVFQPAFERGIWMIFLVPVVVSAWRGRLGQALLTIAVGTIGNVVFLASAYSQGGITAENVLRAIVFGFVSVSTAIVADRLEKSRRNLQEALQAERGARARIRSVTDGVEAMMLPASPPTSAAAAISAGVATAAPGKMGVITRIRSHVTQPHAAPVMTAQANRLNQWTARFSRSDPANVLAAGASTRRKQSAVTAAGKRTASGTSGGTRLDATAGTGDLTPVTAI